tara:strand:- start:3239 stop:3400 length:162 start_codon:yes stop_codon:yes gene_type:complete
LLEFRKINSASYLNAHIHPIIAKRTRPRIIIDLPLALPDLSVVLKGIRAILLK